MSLKKLSALADLNVPFTGLGVTLQHLEKLLKPHSRRYMVPEAGVDQQNGSSAELTPGTDQNDAS